MNFEEKINYWFKSSSEDLITAEKLLKEKSFSWALFILHISVEKKLKGYFLKKSKSYLYT
ncbi:MAG: HEPN domain-containing protein [Ignavibacteriaceae bacterium]|nr:HEPN domain-containing protein [Ignavibacteriaceae bacterium]